MTALLILLIFPHQLFDPHPGIDLQPDEVLFIEDSLFFGDTQYPAKFHLQKLWLHRASMRRYADRLSDQEMQLHYLAYEPGEVLKHQLKRHFDGQASTDGDWAVVDPVDFILEKRLRAAAKQFGAKLEVLQTPGFINTPEENHSYRSEKSRWYMADFYKWQRRRMNVLIDSEGEPQGGQWSFDEDNRKKVPKKLLKDLPTLTSFRRNEIDKEACESVAEQFADNPGSLDELYYPTTHSQAERWLEDFVAQRLENFGPYEDAIEEGQSWLWHSVLTPALNIGLLTPQQVIDEALAYADKNDTPINSIEGFVRQVIGWREFMRATYQDLGVKMRTTNHWKHHRALPSCFYDGSTGIDPIDDTIRRLLETGYCHHIERLMVLGGFMFLCEIDPDDIYRWFMEMFIDSYDWVMVPNVYAMSQNADGGQITTKPYFSGSSYVRKMSHYAKGPWCDVWDGLYWRWIWIHRDELSQNPRWAMMCSMAEKMDDAKMKAHLENAENFLKQISR
ncbi:cryptochrome/photolyase family protein [Stieleria sp. JC731]|uniref:cryptochrome/photolyase family protein n=1 Tax=Pirellulaceae TaxID=2691357 RepID=UPI001E4E2BE6|nr:cryptochrome/photolyase family protein [Stieleria sp. JC731]MCC9602974.1 cryptochrome/photolyase family protein [Stieleria sp. JC731]